MVPRAVRSHTLALVVWGVLSSVAMAASGRLDGTPVQTLAWRFAPAVTPLGIDQGLPADQILALFEDSRRAMWVGTPTGVARLGGREPEVFGMGSGLPRPGVYCFHEDQAGTLWAGTLGGIARLDARTRRFSPAGMEGRVEQFAPAASGGVWVVQRNPPALARLRAGVVERVAADPALLAPKGIAEWQGRLWVADVRAGLLVADLVGDVPGPFRSIHPGPVHEVVSAGEELWSRTETDLLVFSQSGAGPEVREVPGRQGLVLNGLAQTADGVPVVASDQGVFAWRRGRFEALLPDDATPSNGLLVARFDHRGDLWLGTVDRGLRVVRSASGVELLSGGGDLGQFTELPGGRMFASHNGAVFALDRGLDGRLSGRALPLEQGFDPRWIGRPAELDGQVLFPSSRGVVALAGTPGAERLVPDERFAVLERQLVGQVEVDRVGRIWAAGHGGLALLAPGDQVARAVGLTAAGGSGTEFAVDDAGDLWVVSHGRVSWRLRPGDLSVELVAQPCRDVPIGSVARGPEGGVIWGCDDGSWAVTGGRLDGLRSQRTGLDGLVVPTLVEEPSGAFLAAFVDGRVGRLQFSPPRLVEVLADRTEVQGVELAFANGHLQADGAWLLSSLRRVARLVPRSLADEERPGLDLVHGEGAEPHGERWVLGPRPNRATFRVELADPLAASRVRTRWRLDGGRWTSWRNDADIELANLAPGDHLLEVEGSDRYGRPAASPLALPLWAEANWWERSSVQLLGGVLLFGCGWLGMRFRVSWLEAERRRLETAVAARTRELAEANRQLAEASLTDALTGLGNRRLLASIADALEATAHRSQGERLLVVVMDLDHFKSINDSHGHAVGDRTLRDVAEVLRRSVRSSALLVRWGGEEFVVVERLSPDDREEILVGRLRTALLTASLQPAVTASFGWATTPLGPGLPIGWRTAVELADLALYAAKHAGRNCVWHVAWPGGTVTCGTSDVLDRLRRDARGELAAGRLVVEPDPAQP